MSAAGPTMRAARARTPCEGAGWMPARGPRS